MPLAAALEDMAGRIAGREQQLRESNLQLRELAYQDALTGIPNRRAFNAQLAAAWDLARALAEPVAVLIIDVDYFKRFNDRYGHVQGDDCLKKISELLIGATRSQATRGRRRRPFESMPRAHLISRRGMVGKNLQFSCDEPISRPLAKWPSACASG
jgi:GAF domain-containing protein